MMNDNEIIIILFVQVSYVDEIINLMTLFCAMRCLVT